MTRKRKRVWGGLMTLFLLSWAASARANVAAPPPPDPAKLGRLGSVTKTPLVVLQERLSFDCKLGTDAARPRAIRHTGVRPVCAFHASYRVKNPTEQAVEIAAGFYSDHAHGIEVKVDGAVSNAPLTGEERTALEQALKGVEQKRDAELGRYSDQAVALQTTGFRTSFAAGQTRTIDVTGTMLLGKRQTIRGYAQGATRVRHPKLGTDHWDHPDRHYELEYLIYPIHTWAAVGPIEVTVRYPDSWQLRGGLLVEGSGKRSRSTSFERRSEGDRIIATTKAPGARVAGLDVEFTLSASPFHHGGPVVGLGGTFGDGGGFRMRFGWEVAAPDWLLYSFNADTDFEERLVLAPVIEAATPSFLGIIPSASLGLGVPIRVVPIAHVGMRSQAAINFAYVGFVTSVDWYPGISSGDPDHLDVTLMGRLSL